MKPAAAPLGQGAGHPAARMPSSRTPVCAVRGCAVQVGDLLQHFKSSVISVDQAAALISGLGVQVV
jgi:hypothetical protein